MSTPNQTPAYLRYLKARLKPFGRPAFWASAMGLLLMLFFAWEYWNNPGEFSFKGAKKIAALTNQSDEPKLSSDELAAISADIDSSSVLLSEVDTSNVLPLATLPNQASQDQNSEGLFSQILRQQAEAKSKQEQKSPAQTGTTQQRQPSTNPFATSAQELLNTGLFSGSYLATNSNSTNRQSSSSATGATADSALGFNSVNGNGNTNRGAVPLNPLENALNRVTPANNPTTATGIQSSANVQNQALPAPSYQGQTTYPPATVPGATGYNTSPTTPPAPQNSYTYLAPAQPGMSVPGTVSGAPVPTGMPSTVGQYSTQPYGQSNGVSNPGFNSPQGNLGVQPSQLNQPNYTTPRPIPGRYIGGGQINTFSNP